MLACRLSKILRLPVINLDSFYWKPGWKETGKKEWEVIVSELTKRKRWIMDGNYGGTLSIRLKAADTVIFLDYSRYLCLWRGLKRQFTRVRPDPIPGCYEKIDKAYISWIWNYPRRIRPLIKEILDKEGQGKSVLIFNKPRKTSLFLERLKVR